MYPQRVLQRSSFAVYPVGEGIVGVEAAEDVGIDKVLAALAGGVFRTAGPGS